MEVALSDPTIRAALLTSAAPMQNAYPDTPRRIARRANRAEARTLAADPLLTAEEAAAEAGIAISTWWKWVKLGRFPAPSYPLPRCPRWRRSEVRAAALEGAAQGGEARCYA
jgi:predicted DNA-binding transcriptional regulator AlpA